MKNPVIKHNPGVAMAVPVAGQFGKAALIAQVNAACAARGVKVTVYRASELLRKEDV